MTDESRLACECCPTWGVDILVAVPAGFPLRRGQRESWVRHCAAGRSVLELRPSGPWRSPTNCGLISFEEDHKAGQVRSRMHFRSIPFHLKSYSFAFSTCFKTAECGFAASDRCDSDGSTARRKRRGVTRRHWFLQDSDRFFCPLPQEWRGGR